MAHGSYSLSSYFCLPCLFSTQLGAVPPSLMSTHMGPDFSFVLDEEWRPPDFSSSVAPALIVTKTPTRFKFLSLPLLTGWLRVESPQPASARSRPWCFLLFTDLPFCWSEVLRLPGWVWERRGPLLAGALVALLPHCLHLAEMSKLTLSREVSLGFPEALAIGAVSSAAPPTWQIHLFQIWYAALSTHF